MLEHVVKTACASSKFFFADAKAITRLCQEQQLMRVFISAKAKIFYTETSLQELRNKITPKLLQNFIFIRSGITSQQKELTFNLFKELLHQGFRTTSIQPDKSPIAVKSPASEAFGAVGTRETSISTVFLNSYQRDLNLLEALPTFKTLFNTVVEAGYSCYRKDVTPKDYLDTVPLISEDGYLNQILSNSEACKALENTINLSGYEHLIEVISMKAAINSCMRNLEPHEAHRRAPQ